MKKILSEFIRRGLLASGMGPLILTVLYLILQRHGILQPLTVSQVCTGIFSLWALAFVAGGMNVVYQIERLPLMVAISIHGSVLYVSYLGTYLLNDWLAWGTAPLLVFTVIFVVGYLAIWAVICAVIRRNAKKLNQMLEQQQKKHKGAVK